jgi:glyoxylase-like metal-dependent hydrolase (beta-lactamase superfamily II)
VINDEGDKAVLIDAGVDSGEILKALEERGLELEAVLVTHGHPDHLLGLKGVIDATEAPCYMHPLDAEMARMIPPVFLRVMGIDHLEIPDGILPLEDGQILELAGMEFKVLYTPGHSQGSVCFHIDGVVFTGDLLFRGSIGRTDFPGGSFDVLVKSVKEKIWTLPGDTRVYPGHMDATVVGWERKTNPFLLGT